MAAEQGQYRPSRYKDFLAGQAPLRLLVLEDSAQTVEPLVSLFRNEGYPTRVHRVTSLEDLEESLSEHPWDLFLIYKDAEALPAETALAETIRLDRDIPSLLLTDTNDAETVTSWLFAGGADTVPVDQTARFMLVCQREWFNLVQRRQRRANERALKDAEKRCQLLLNSSVDAIAYIHEGMHIHANPTYVDLFGFYDPDDLTGISLIDIIHPDDQTKFKTFFRNFQHNSDDCPPLDFKGRKEDGSEFQASMVLSTAKWDDELCTQIIIRKASADPELEKKLELLKNTDQVTGLYNRNFFNQKLDKAIDQAHNQHKHYSVMDIRLDRYDDLSNELGPEITEQFLASIGKILSAHLQNAECIARYSQGTFLAVINTNIQSTQEQLASSLIDAIQQHSITFHNVQVETTASIGIMPITDTADSGQYILTRAEKACRAAQKDGGNRYKFHDQQAELQEKAREGDMAALIQQAIEQDQFQLSFQPIINFEDEQEQQYEVFSLLLNTEGEVIPAAEFLPTARRAQLINRIDRWVILNAIKALSAKYAKGQNVRLFITLGLESIQDQTLPAWVNVALRTARIPASALVIQLCEEDVAVAGDGAKPVCEAFIKLGCELCLTHFGGAVDPMAVLDSIPASMVKLEDSLLEDVESDSQVLDRLNDITQVLKEKNKQVLVPKVESSKKMSTLWGCDINYVQGNFLQPPMPEMSYDFET